jgi:hypothetical protein
MPAEENLSPLPDYFTARIPRFQKERSGCMMCKLLIKSVILSAYIGIGSASIFAGPIPEKDESTTNRDAVKTVNIIWRQTLREDGIMAVTGSLEIASGKYEIRWIISDKGQPRLIAQQLNLPDGMPSSERKILILPQTDGTTSLFLDKGETAGTKNPSLLRFLALVKTAELFLPIPQVPVPTAAAANQLPTRLSWGKPYIKNTNRYIPGSFEASFGKLNISWKKTAEGRVELIGFESPGAGELPPRETPFLFWIDPERGLAFICSENAPQLNEKRVSYLVRLGTVYENEILEGLKRLEN